ncbi:nucleotidyltransferase-like protein [Kribbella amoyensis]|uniref:Nucleotidyltransferase-like protein n=1 Tax=Kribbella amoyensis TaxID=996641 RepID=A0A561BX51_9ACTN|nr:nucleotidyltransferase domain-containing protein [Kribbella amoyensis]TWD83465.1 nucleotidyltransferase-like protein [Kribbella amoyensis]
MTDEAVRTLLDGFVASVVDVVPVVAIWVHGSLALGDFVPARSDLDLVCLTDGPIPDPSALAKFHRRLMRSSPVGPRLHCTYVPVNALADPSLRHPTFAQRRYFDRPVGLVARRELTLADRSLSGPPPSELLPATSDEDLAAFIRADLGTFWHPVTTKRLPWYRDIWVDLSLITYARATRTLQSGTLITKREALALLPELGAPEEVVADIHHRRYGTASEQVDPQQFFRGRERERPGGTGWSAGFTPRSLAAYSPRWRARRAHLTRTYLHTAIPRLLADPTATGSVDDSRIT